MKPRIVTVSPTMRTRALIVFHHRSGAYRMYTRGTCSPSGRRLFWVLANLVDAAGWVAEPFVGLCGTRYTEPAPVPVRPQCGHGLPADCCKICASRRYHERSL